MEEVAALVADPGIDDVSLRDLTHLPFCTIDEPTSKDLDQALFVETSPRGWVVWYAIADAAWFVRPGTALYREALARGATYYLPGLVIPMLPKELSEDLVSLNPEVDRRAMVFRMEVHTDGNRGDAEIVRARVRSQAKLNYGGVQQFLDGHIERLMPTPQGDESLRLLREVGLARMNHAQERGVVSYRRTEVDAGLKGPRFVAVGGCRHATERYNEQISLLCNTVGAAFLGAQTAGHVEPIYRVHEAPGARRLDALRRQIATLASRHQSDKAVWLWRTEERLSTYLERLPEGRLARAIHRQAIVANHPGRFQSERAGHHGVGAEAYARFSAPMREIIGVFLHCELWEAKAGAPSFPTGGQSEVIARANASKRLQGQLTAQSNRLILDQLFEDGRGPWKATVMGITRSKIHIQLDEPPIDIKVYLRHLQTEGPLVAHEDRTVVVREEDRGEVWRVGDAVWATLQGRDPEADRWRLQLEMVGEYR
jgi:ribonuclease R